MSSSRREFLKSAAGTALAVALSQTSASLFAADSPADSISSSVTDATGKRHAAGPAFAWGPAAQGAGVVLDASKTAQTISGFGAAMTDATCYVIDRMPAEARAKLLDEIFNPAKMGFNVCRLCIGASDYSTEVFSYDEGNPDPDITRFSIDHDRTHVIPVLRQALAINPELFYFAAPWSPPGWMKYGGSMLGGCIKTKYLGPYANYLLKYLQDYRTAGVPVRAITIQNELDADQGERMPACIWAEEVDAEFISGYLGPLLRKNSMDTKIWILDHNYDLVGRVMDNLARPQLRPYISAVAWHGYSGEPEQMKQVWDKYPGYEMRFTEWGANHTDRDYLTGWAKWSANFSRILHNGPGSLTTWNLALDEHGKPNVGPFNCGGLVTVHSQTSEVVRSGLYWTMAHYSRAFRPGCKIVESQGDLAGISHIAALKPDGSMAMILTNAGAAQSVQVTSGNKSADIAMPQDSVMTLEWT